MTMKCKLLLMEKFSEYYRFEDTPKELISKISEQLQSSDAEGLLESVQNLNPASNNGFMVKLKLIEILQTTV